MRKNVMNWIGIVLLTTIGLLLWTSCISTAPGPDPAVGVENIRVYKIGYGLTEYYLIADGYLPSDTTKMVEAAYGILDDYIGTSIEVAENEIRDKLDAELEGEPLTDQQKASIRRMATAVMTRIKNVLPNPEDLITVGILRDLKCGIDAALIAHEIIEDE